MSKVTAATLARSRTDRAGRIPGHARRLRWLPYRARRRTLAGGRSLATPFGNIPVPNITPDRETGLGDWSFEDFWQALHVGKGRHGELLYPAFSYTSYTKVTHDDALAMFAYLRSLPPVHQPAHRRRWIFRTACARA